MWSSRSLPCPTGSKSTGVRVSFENVPLTRAFWVAENCKNDESPFHGTYCKVWKTSGTVGLLDGSVVSELCVCVTPVAKDSRW